MNQGLNSVTGQSALKELLAKSIDSARLSHAYIFEGDSGMGKKTLAYAFARQLVCENKTACGQCRSCRLALSANHPDIITVTPEEGKQTISVDIVRGLYETVMTKPFSADKKIIIIPDAEKLVVQAQNALLKMLEEPPSYIIFILLTSNSNFFLETILSRCIKLSFQPYTEEEIRTVLSSKGITDIPDAALCFADGNCGKAFSLVSGGSFLELRSRLAELFGLFFEDNTKLFDIISFIEENKDVAEDIFDILLSFARELTMCHLCRENVTGSGFIAADYLAQTSLKGCMAFLDKVIEYKKMLLSNVNYSLLVNSFVLGSKEVLGW
ncbi:MAG: DNA polymerase III subunit delta' [Clostridia bacterium]|nr:DNA polymerase III subunit delta' [Clostridia bacterium]